MKKNIIELLFFIVSGLIIACFLLSENLNLTWFSDDKSVISVDQDIRMAWGICIDSVSIDSLKIKPNQSLSDILSPLGVSPLIVDKLARNSASIFDVRKIQAGKKYFLIYPGSNTSPSHLIYEGSLRDYYVFHLADSIHVLKGEKQVDTILCKLSGVIESSLWNSLSGKGVNPVLAVEMADIFAWTIDFFGIKKGDRYKVVYDELYVEEKFSGFGRIHAALFESAGVCITAYFFDSDQQKGYFDTEGNSLRKAFLKAPLKFSRISSHYSHSRMHPILKIRRPHHGVDYTAPTGTPVYSIGDGVVVKKAFQSGGGGNYLTIKHNSVYASQYMHLNGYAKGITGGVRVKQGQIIGYVGKTGLASGPHLDFRIYKNGSPVDPLKVEAPPVEPVSDTNRYYFIMVKDSLDKLLVAIPFEELSLSGQ